MTTATFAELIEAAEAEGFTNELLPIGEYDVEVAGTSAGTSQGNKPQVGVRFKVTTGPYAGKSFWLNITLTVDNPKAVAVFFRQLGQLGVSTDFVKTLPLNETGMKAIASAIIVGAQFHVTHGHRAWNGKTYADVKNIKAIGAPLQTQAAPAVLQPSAPAPVPQAVAQPAPVAPVQTPAVVPAPTAAF